MVPESIKQRLQQPVETVAEVKGHLCPLEPVRAESEFLLGHTANFIAPDYNTSSPFGTD